ncbi:MAG: DUF6088 family protein [bacterium]
MDRIQDWGRGSVFIPTDFLNLGSRQAVDIVLHRLAKAGTIRRLTRGLYDYPRTHPQLGLLAPSLEAITKALAGKNKLRLQPTGAYAANLLHLSEQVPAKIDFLTDGNSRTYHIINRTIRLKRTTPRNMSAAGRTSGLVIQALRYLGKNHATNDRITTLRKVLSTSDRKKLLEDMALAPAWMRPILQEVAGGGKPS